MSEPLRFAQFRDEIGHANLSLTTPLSGGGTAVAATLPPPPPGRRYALEQTAGGGCQVVIVSLDGAIARTTDCSSVLERMNAVNKAFWDRRTAVGTAR